MSNRMTASFVALGSKMNGWVKVGVVLAGTIAAFATLKANVTHLERDVVRVETQAEKARDAMEKRTVEQLREMNRKLDEIQKMMLEERGR